MGVEFEHIESAEERAWLYSEYEAIMEEAVSKPEQAWNFALAYRAELFDQYLAKKFPGFKRYSLEGNEALMPLLNSVLASAGASGLENCVLTMPHRGRLNVLSLLLDYPLALLLRKIQGGCDLPG